MKCTKKIFPWLASTQIISGNKHYFLCTRVSNIYSPIFFYLAKIYFFDEILTEAFFQSHFSGAIPSWDFPTTMKS